MYDLTCLIKRNIKNFLRDKAAVFFSLLSVIILLALYFLFIGRQYTQGEAFDSVSPELKTFLSTGVIMGGVLVINTVSLSLGVMGNIIMDLDTRKLDGFLVTPVKRYKIILSYYISSILVTFTLTLFMWVLTILYLGVTSGYWYTIETIFLTTVLLLLYTFLSATLMIFMTTLLKSVNAFGALSGVLGTLIGFMSGIYMPLSVLGNAMSKVASVIPFTHMTVLLKQVLLKEAYQELPEPFVSSISVFYGTNDVGLLGMDISSMTLVFGSVIIGFILMFIAYRNMNQKMIK
ncbi:MAG: hypothetical protein CVV61_02645 [Tenericutes bacterium HGW-Tenericutes-6]|nr:MAG: hypothetical protein CVV61_02645 [Tenericutes bacterium HGW-Tenericutes-6]